MEPSVSPEPEPPEGAAADADGAASPDAGAEPAGETEYRARHGNVSVAILRWERRTITDFALTGIPKGGGVYLICMTEGTAELPAYVGEADQFALRWHKRLLEAYQLGLVGRGPLPHPITAWFGSMAPLPGPLRRAVETLILRTLLLSGVAAPGGLRNERQLNPIEIAGAISVRNLLPASWAQRVAPGVAQALAQARSGSRTAAQQRRVVSLEVLQRGWNGRDLTVPQTLAGTVFELAAD